MTQRERLPIAFTTLGCPAWDWNTILRQAQYMGYAGIELRGLQGEINLTRCPEFSGTRLRQTRAELQEHDLRVIGLGSSAQLHERIPDIRATYFDEVRRYVDLAVELGASYVRVFPNHLPADQPRGEVLARIRDGMRTLAEYAETGGISILLESHGDVTDSQTLVEIMGSIDATNVGLLWDIGNMYMANGEAPADVYERLAFCIRHVHLKDADANGRYVLTGAGVIPLREAIRALVADGYSGWYCFEWEKRWHPEIAEPAVALPHFISVIRAYLAEARNTPSTL
jgi:sugar phosphate isomerase/epimerase